jgi:glycine hydroxymethyltransferase
MNETAPLVAPDLVKSLTPRLARILEAHRAAIVRSVHLIASASYPFPAAMAVLAEPACVLPVEGWPHQRYLPGASAFDEVEDYAEELILGLFDCASAKYGTSIQPHSGTQANQVVFNAVLRPGDKALSLATSDGGHVSHHVLVGRRDTALHYRVNASGLLDYDEIEHIATIEAPRLIIAGGSSYPRSIDFARLSAIASRCGAYLHADVSHTATLIAAGLHPAVTPHADFVTFNTVKNMRGPNGGVLVFKERHRKAVREALFPTTQGGANENTMLGKLVALELLSGTDLVSYAARLVSLARLIARVLTDRGLTIVTGGTDSHLVIVDLRATDRTGASVEVECMKSGVLLNRNLIPGDPRPPMETSGVRIGTACIAILGYSDGDATALANWIADRILGERTDEDPAVLVDYLVHRYPVPI